MPQIIIFGIPPRMRDDQRILLENRVATALASAPEMGFPQYEVDVGLINGTPRPNSDAYSIFIHIVGLFANDKRTPAIRDEAVNAVRSATEKFLRDSLGRAPESIKVIAPPFDTSQGGYCEG